MGHEELVMAVRVVGALVIGAAIGFERTFWVGGNGQVEPRIGCWSPRSRARGR